VGVVMDELSKEKIKSTILVNAGSKVYIESKSEFYLIGTRIDFVKEDYSKNIFESKCTFTQDKEKASSCGCGVSFSPRFQ
jgi:Fe-S cluster assembly iron-binding protein IscA